MAVDFRCEKCGKLLSVDAQPGGKVTCPHCRKAITVPEGLASLPRPKVPVAAGAAPAAAGAPGGAAQGEEEILEEEGESDVFVSAMAKTMPFVISIFFHLGLLLVFALVTLAVTRPPGDEDKTPLSPEAAMMEDTGAPVVDRELTQDEARKRTESDSRRRSTIETPIPSDAGKTDHRIVIGMGTPTGGTGSNLLPGGGGGGSGSGFFGTGGGGSPIHHVVYVIDRSGSMHDTFDIVAREMINSIGQLRAKQDFHVVFFSTGAPVENPPKRLVPASRENKADVATFLEGIIPQGQTDPVPALQRAFAVLSAANKNPGKIIYLLTDGAFRDNESVLRTIRERNTKKDVFINTYLFQYRAEHAMKVMQQIADENRGKFKYVSVDE